MLIDSSSIIKPWIRIRSNHPTRFEGEKLEERRLMIPLRKYHHQYKEKVKGDKFFRRGAQFIH